MQSTLIVSTGCSPVLPKVQRSAPPAVRRESSSGRALPTEIASLRGYPKGLPPPLDCNRERPTRRPRRAIARRSSRPAGSPLARMPRSHRSPSTSPGTAAGAAGPGAPITPRGSPACNQGAYQRRYVTQSRGTDHATRLTGDLRFGFIIGWAPRTSTADSKLGGPIPQISSTSSSACKGLRTPGRSGLACKAADASSIA